MLGHLTVDLYERLVFGGIRRRCLSPLRASGGPRTQPVSACIFANEVVEFAQGAEPLFRRSGPRSLCVHDPADNESGLCSAACKRDARSSCCIIGKAASLRDASAHSGEPPVLERCRSQSSPMFSLARSSEFKIRLSS